jgi:hypothetical protein
MITWTRTTTMQAKNAAGLQKSFTLRMTPEYNSVVHRDFQQGIPLRNSATLYIDGRTKLFGDPPAWLAEALNQPMS